MGKKKMYKTQQRVRIYEVMQENADGYLTAGEVLAHLKARGVRIGLTTVYRSLKMMTEQGALRRYKGPGEGMCYQVARAGCEEHFHLCCSLCGKTVHLDCEYAEKIDKHLLKHHGFQVDEGRTVLYGVCEQCRGPKSEMM